MVATVLHSKTPYAHCHVVTDDYQAALISAAVDYHRRGWVPIPIAYRDENPIPPKGWVEWAGRRPDEREMRRMIGSHPMDALAVHIGSTGCAFLDVDDLSQVTMVGGVSAPAYSTSRGLQRVVRLDQPVGSTIDLRRWGVAGELRSGDCFSIVPPSRHRRHPETTYTWTRPLPLTDPQIPSLSLSEILTTDRASLIQYLRQRTTTESRDTFNNLIVRQFRDGGLSEIIEATLPAGVGNRRPMLPVLMRHLMRANPDMSAAEVAAAGSLWWQVARDRGLTREKSATQTVASLLHLYRTYDRTKCGVLRAATKLMESIEAVTSVEPHWRNRAGRPVLVRLATLCRAMDLVCGGGVWPLSSYDAAEIVGADQRTAWRMMQRLQQLKLIRCVARGTPNMSVGHGVVVEGDAAEYQFVGFPSVPPIGDQIHE